MMYVETSETSPFPTASKTIQSYPKSLKKLLPRLIINSLPYYNDYNQHNIATQVHYKVSRLNKVFCLYAFKDDFSSDAIAAAVASIV